LDPLVRESTPLTGNVGGSPMDKKAKTPKKPKQTKNKDRSAKTQ
jgi:hypothetical protein